MTTLVREPLAFRAACEAARATGKSVALVPTMGALHQGHLSLVEMAQNQATFVAVSIFVNPKQFGKNEDFSRYPRDLASDLVKLIGVDLVFAPEVSAMYPEGDATRVRVDALSGALCGPFRPGHFEGVATIVTKLLMLTGLSKAVFGRKDYQQLVIIERIVNDLFLPVTIVKHPIVRESDGVAMSSRNAYLSAKDRIRARCLSRGLFAAADLFARGERVADTLRTRALEEVESVADRIDYVAIVDPDRLTPIEGTIRNRALLAVACHVGTTRLIDNVVLGDK